MNKSLLVAVFVPTTDEAGTDFDGQSGQLATGYPVGENLILTARHVPQPEPPNYRDERYPIKIRWDSYKNSGWIEIEDIVLARSGRVGCGAASLFQAAARGQGLGLRLR